MRVLGRKMEETRCRTPILPGNKRFGTAVPWCARALQQPGADQGRKGSRERSGAEVWETLDKCRDGAPAVIVMKNLARDRRGGNPPADRIVLKDELVALPVTNQIGRPPVEFAQSSPRFPVLFNLPKCHRATCRNA